MTGPVGIVLVSHSPELASGVRTLLRQLGGETVPIETAGGTDDGGIGTSYALVDAAIGRAERGAGVVVLADLGSSVLTARAVLHDGGHAGAELVDAPFVEGAVAAVVTAATGADRSAVVEAAREAREIPKF